MPFQLSSDQVTRLALARYLLQHAEAALKSPQPLCSLALLFAHDAIEMLLDVLAETVNASIATGSNFDSYWNGLKNSSAPVHLPLERQMKRLNRARVALKHHGQRPSGDQLIAHLDNARAFMEDVCDKNFAATLSDISLIDLIKNERVRDLLRDAHQAVDRDELQEAFTKAAIAMAYGSTDDYQSLYRRQVSERTRLEKFSFVDDDIYVYDTLASFARTIDNTFDHVFDRLGDVISLVSLGIDLTSYNKFNMLTPVVGITASGKAHHVWRRTPSDKQEDARWCIDFVTDLVLRVEGRGSEV